MLTDAARALADADCPTSTASINTDRPGLANSSLVVPYGSFQAENGIDWAVNQGSNFLSGSSTRLRLGVAHCTEFLIDAPNYIEAMNGPHASGFSDVVVSIKRQIPVPPGFTLAATAGIGFPSGTTSGPGYQPYLQAPWSYEIGEGWSGAGMFGWNWIPSDSNRNLTFVSDFSLGRELGQSANTYVEYGGSYNHQRPAQVLDTGGQWRFTDRQQVDFQAGFGLNSSSVDHFVGVGYSFRLDGLFGVHGTALR